MWVATQKTGTPYGPTEAKVLRLPLSEAAVAGKARGSPVGWTLKTAEHTPQQLDGALGARFERRHAFGGVLCSYWWGLPFKIKTGSPKRASNLQKEIPLTVEGC